MVCILSNNNNNNNIVETAVSRTTALMNVKVILQVAYMSAFRPSFCLNGSFARVFKIFCHRHTHTQYTHTGPITLPLRKRGVMIWCSVYIALFHIHLRILKRLAGQALGIISCSYTHN